MRHKNDLHKITKTFFESEIVEVAEAVEETVIPAVVVPKYKCPTEKKGYKIIQKQCYFIETARRKFGDAQDNCKKVFDNKKEGRVFEPRTTERNDEVRMKHGQSCAR